MYQRFPGGSKRNSTVKQYNAEKAEIACHKRRANCGRISKWSPELAAVVSEELDAPSMEQAVRMLHHRLPKGTATVDRGNAAVMKMPMGSFGIFWTARQYQNMQPSRPFLSLIRDLESVRDGKRHTNQKAPTVTCHL